MNKPKIPIVYQQVKSYLSKKIAHQFPDFIINVFHTSDKFGKSDENIKVADSEVKTVNRAILLLLGMKYWGTALPGRLLMLPKQMKCSN